MTGFGRPQYAQINHRLNARFADLGTLVMAHRGTPVGSIPRNSTGAVLGAVRSGADIVELDVTGSTDGVFFAHHDGLEPEHLTLEVNLRTLPAAAIEMAGHRWLGHPLGSIGLERIESLLVRFKSAADDAVIFNIDRSWPWWPSALGVLEDLQMPEQLILKCPAGMTEAVDHLAAARTKFPYVPICHTQAGALRYLDRDDLNLVGVELIWADDSSELADPGFIERLHEAGLFVVVNALVLPASPTLSAGWDDELAIHQGSAAGWGPLFDRHVDVIQTDWPWLLADYRDVRAAGKIGS